MEEPCIKKQRIESPEPTFKLKAILSDDLCKPIPLDMVVVSRIENKKLISSVILELSRCLPLPSLQHLKRVRQNEIILCKKSDVRYTIQGKQSLTESEVLQIREYIESRGIPTLMALSLCKSLSLVEVASIPTRLRWQYDAMNQLWPCKFHPNQYMESLFNGTHFSKVEEVFHSRIASILKKLSDAESTNIGICIDPRSNSIVSVATGRTLQNPIMHCPMVLVDLVACSQNEGAWQYDDEKFHESNDEKLNFRGIPERFYNTIVDTLKENIKFGAENINFREERREITEDMSSCNNLEKFGPYLCTGYDVYLMAEPCLMCAMALVHSRVRRIFYLVASDNGALRTKIKLHTIKELNHHFEVFQCCSNGKQV